MEKKPVEIFKKVAKKIKEDLKGRQEYFRKRHQHTDDPAKRQEQFQKERGLDDKPPTP